MIKAVSRISLCLVILLALSPSGLAKHAKQPPDPRFLAIDQIVVLPPLDVRSGKKDNVNLESLRKSAVGQLKARNYVVRTSDDTGNVGEIAEEDLKDAKPDWIRKLGPSDSRWVMVIGLGEAHAQMTFGSTGNAEVIGYLFDRQSGTVLWNGTGVGQAGQGGLAGMAMKGMMKGMALDSAVANLLTGIPKLPKKSR